MCGICGVALSPRSSRTISRSTLERMRDVLVHRGPDDSGVFLDAGIGLGHRRLSIVDVTHGHQPMLSEDGELCIVYNGEVYNHPELSVEFQARGICYRTHCDTETVLHAFDVYGARCTEHFRGMFAFAIWNRRRRELFLARDRLGVKPLYYALTDDGSLYFASEIKAILASGAIPARLHLSAMPDYLANHATSGEVTLYAGIKRLLPGHTLRWRDGEVQIERYWDLDIAPRSSVEGDERSLVQEYRDRLRDSVRMRLMADVPLGSFLSGGIDSAAITALMAELVGSGVKTFSVAFAEREANELAYARLVAERFQTDHHEVVVSPGQFFSALPRLLWHEDEPIAHPSSVPLHFVSRLAREHVKVVLTGEGSDETLAGYGRYRATLRNLALGRRWERLGGNSLRPLTRRMIDVLPRKSRYRRLLTRTFLYLPSDLTTLYFDNFAVFSRTQQNELLLRSVREELSDPDPYSTLEQYVQAHEEAPLLSQLLYADIKTYLHELLMKQDQMSMAASIESRVPFLDHPLMEFAAALPEHMKLRGNTTKYVLREAMRDTLPEPILRRAKMGFPVPVGSWLTGDYRAVTDEYILGERARSRGLFDYAYAERLVEEHARGHANHAERLWALLNFELWQRVFIDDEGVDRTTRSMTRLLGVGTDVEVPPGVSRPARDIAPSIGD